MGLLVSGKGYHAIPGKFENTVRLGRIMFSYLFLVTTYAYFMAILNAHKQFFVPAMAPAAFNVCFIVFALMPSVWSRFPGEMLAWGVIAGGGIQILAVVFPLWKQKILPHLTWRWKIPGLKRVLVNMVPGIIGSGVLQFLSLVNINFASRLAEDSHTYIYLSDRILELPQSLIAISLGAALLPTLSEYWSAGMRDKMLTVGQRHMRTLMFLSIPSAVGMFILARPIVEVLYMRGKFHADDVIKTAMVVRFYAFLLTANSLSKVIIPNFYAIKNTWLPAMTSATSILCHIVIANLVIGTYGLKGLVASMTFAGILNLILVLTFYLILIGPIGLKENGKFLLKLAVPLATMAIFANFFHPAISSQLHTLMAAKFARVISLFTTIILSVVIYFLVSGKMKLQPAEAVLKRFKR